MDSIVSRIVRRAAQGGAALAGAAALVVVGAAGAGAHVSFTAGVGTAGAYAVLTLSVPHGCDAAPTTEVSIQMPEGINAVTPTRNGFYEVEKVMEDLETPITDSHGNEVTERVAQVVYTAIEPLPADQRDALELSLQLPEDAAGTTLYFPTLQTCGDVEEAWVQIPEESQDPHSLDAPAPAIEVVSADAEPEAGESAQPAEEPGAAGVAAGAEGSTSGDEGPGGLVVTALVVGALGLIVGVVGLLRGRPKA